MEKKPLIINERHLTWHKPMVNRLFVSLDTGQGAPLSSQVEIVTAFGGPQQSIVTATSDFAGG